jgi:hypothetical protein
MITNTQLQELKEGDVLWYPNFAVKAPTPLTIAAITVDTQRAHYVQFVEDVVKGHDFVYLIGPFNNYFMSKEAVLEVYGADAYEPGSYANCECDWCVDYGPRSCDDDDD